MFGNISFQEVKNTVSLYIVHESGDALQPSPFFPQLIGGMAVQPSPFSPQLIAGMADSASKRMTIKLFYDPKSNKVLFAEVGKDFTDFLFGLLHLPLGSIIKLVRPLITLGSTGKLYQSVENMDETYLVSNQVKSTLLEPAAVSVAGANHLFLTGSIVATPRPKTTYYCRSCCLNSDGNSCTRCHRSLESVEGLVKGGTTYIIRDDLEVKPMSLISVMVLINRYFSKENAQLEEKTVVVGMKEGLALLVASLKSTTVLTDVFLNPEEM